MNGNNHEGGQQAAPSIGTQESANAKDEKHAEIGKLTQKIEKVMEFLTNQLGNIIQEQIKKTLEKENHSKLERTAAERNNTQKNYNIGLETEVTKIDKDSQPRLRKQQ